MEVKVFSELEGCPDGCQFLDIVTQVASIGGEPIVFVDCSHSNACAMWNDRIGGEYDPCKGSTRKR